jgi:hypothetical protein
LILRGSGLFFFIIKFVINTVLIEAKILHITEYPANFKTKMTQNEKQLWERIQAFNLDEKDVQLTFTERLARENGWDMKYTYRVVDEYKKFIFLCCVSPTPVTPSDPVDQAWHLHLTYTKSYWQDFCRDTLNRDIHHNPTKGGETEKEKFNDCYTTLQELYKEKFSEAPPEDIWHDNKTRFSEIHFRRLNLSANWVISKSLKKRIFQIIHIAVVITGTILIDSVPALFGFYLATTLMIIVVNNYKNIGNKTEGSYNCYFGGCAADGGSGGCSADSGCSGCGGCGGGD